MNARLMDGGMMFLSGLLTIDRDEILQRLQEQGFFILEEIRENEWIALAVTR
jgi:ribosomal protein L11 methylase PrmA